MSRRALLLSIAVVVLGAGCPKDEESFRFDFALAPEKHNCPDPADSSTLLAQSVYTLRLSFLRREGELPTAKPALVCDRVFPPTTAKEAIEIMVPTEKGTKFSVLAEAFFSAGAGAATLEYSGQAEELDLASDKGKVYLRGTIWMRKTKPDGMRYGQSCVKEARVRRAFHSATLLPNGGVLLMGGLVGDKNGKGDAPVREDRTAAYATGAVEYFDPVSGEFTLVSPSIPPRAFHQAVLLPYAPDGCGKCPDGRACVPGSCPCKCPYEILLVGGIKPGTGPAAEVAVAARLPALFSPADGSAPAEAALVSFTPPATGEPGTLVHRLLGPNIPRTFFPAAVVAAEGNATILVSAGGGKSYAKDTGFEDEVAFSIALQSAFARGNKDPNPATVAPLRRSRVGHAIARLADGRYLVAGGNMISATPEVSESFKLDKSTSSDSQGTHVGWHTLTAIGGGSGLLLAGGYPLEDDTPATKPRLVSVGKLKPPPWLQWYDGSGGGLALKDIDASAEGHFPSAGYHEALALPDGSALLLGGNAARAECGANLSCPQDHVVIYGWNGSSPVLATPSQPDYRKDAANKDKNLRPWLDVARFGHRATRLLDGTVLVTGGITKVGDGEFTREAERINPRSGSQAEDLFGRLPAKDSVESKVKNAQRCERRGGELPAK